MKAFKIIPFLSLFLVGFLLSSCANADKAEVVANDFYGKMQAQKYQELEKLLSDKMIEESSKEVIMEFITQKDALGELISFSKEEDGKVMEINNNQVVRFLYVTKYTNKELFEYLRLAVDSETYSIETYGYFDTKEKRDEFIQHVE